MAPLIAFTGQPLDRADHLRRDDSALAQLRRDDALLLALDGLAPQDAGEAGLHWLTLDHAAKDAELVFLGLLGGRAAFAAVPDQGDPDPAFTRKKTWDAIARLPAADIAIYGAARSLIDWHARHRFCAQCGQGTQPAKGGWQRDCGSCGASHFPRTDPVAIMLVEYRGPLGVKLLLGRQERFPAGSYSALAGFVEPGESFEEAAAREVFEETGVRIRDVGYIACQPWPFPSQLMIGCIGTADSLDLRIDYHEIEDARWFSFAEVSEAVTRRAESSSFIPPPSQAIADYMLRWWVERETSLEGQDA